MITLRLQSFTLISYRLQALVAILRPLTDSPRMLETVFTVPCVVNSLPQQLVSSFTCHSIQASTVTTVTRCRRGFVRKIHHTEHMRIHEGLRYHCEYCSKPFVSKQKYRYHLSNHTGQYRFKCDKCEKGFNEKTVFEKHRNSCWFRNK